jgi:hypothetical protein
VQLAMVTLMLVQAVQPTAEPRDVWSVIDPQRVCAMASVWQIHVPSMPAPSEMVETVAPLTVNGREVWRAMHTPLRGAEDMRAGVSPGSDFYDIDRTTLEPLQSEHRGGGTNGVRPTVTRFDYARDSSNALRLGSDGTTLETIGLMGRRPFPEGPGAAALLPAIAWRDGLRLRAQIVDRWRGRDGERLRAVDFVVSGREESEVGGRRVPVYVVTESAVDGSYRTVSHITIARPHMVVRVEHTRRGGRPVVSNAVATMHDPACAGIGGVGPS